MLSLEEYSLAAKKIINTHLKRNNKLHVIRRNYNECVGEVVRLLVEADQRYNTEKSDLTPYQFRRCYAIRGLSWFINRQMRYDAKTEQSPDDFANMLIVNEDVKDDRDDAQYVKFLMANANLSPLQRKYVDFYLQGMDVAGIAALDDVSEQNVYQTLALAFAKMRKIGCIKKRKIS